MVISKAVTIKAASGATPIVDAGKKYPAFLVMTNNVWIEGFTVRNGGPAYSGFYVIGGNAMIANNAISGCGWGIYMASGGGSTVRGNTISGATSRGIEAYGSRQNKILDNTVTGSATGIRLYSTTGNLVTGNSLSGNTVDLKIEGSSGNTLYLNSFRGTASVAGSNTFSSPSLLAYSYHGSTFAGYLGNYWSAYRGGDANGNGVGDTAYSGTTFRDSYPLMEAHTGYLVS